MSGTEIGGNLKENGQKPEEIQKTKRISADKESKIKQNCRIIMVRFLSAERPKQNCHFVRKHPVQGLQFEVYCTRLHVNLCTSREDVVRRGVPLVLREISDGRREHVMSLMWVGWKAV